MSAENLQQDGNVKTEAPVKRIGIFLDDESLFSEEWARAFKCKELSCRVVSTDDRARRLYRGISTADLARVSIAVIDQGFAWMETGKFIKRLRDVNPDAFILETSGDPWGQSYPGSNAVMINDSDQIEIRQLIKKAPTLGLKIAKLKFYSNEERVEAQKADPNSEFSQNMAWYRKYDPHQSLRRLMDHKLFDGVLSMLQTDTMSFLQVVGDSDENKLRQILHYGWNLTALMSANANKDEYANTLTQLSRLLETSII